MDNDKSLQPLNHEIPNNLDRQSLSHGAAIDNLDEPLVLYRNRSKAIAELNRRFLFLMLYPVLIYFMTQESLLALGIFAWFAFFYLAALRSHMKSVRPILEILPEGLVIHSLITQFPLIPWSEIKEVRAYRCMYKLVGIYPNDLNQTLARGSALARLVGWNNAFWAPLYRTLGCPVAPINIPELYLPLSASDVAEQIELRKARALERITAAQSDKRLKR